MEIDVEVKGLIELQEKTEKMIIALHGEPMFEAMKDSVLTVQRHAKLNAPVDTGRLRASILPEIRSSQADAIEGVVGTNVVYAPDVEFGTKPHIIYPKSGYSIGHVPVLAFHWKNGPNGAGMYFFRYVSHPGTKARRYMQKAFEDNRDDIKRRFERAVQEIVEL